ncbi:MAG: hypothetical protein Tsb0019_23810 [Roseibium sp.]
MTAAAYSAERRWDIPVYVWPPVLGVSVALHLSPLVFGFSLPDWPQQEPEELTETEIVIESGGVVFEELVLQEAQVLETATTETASVVEAAEPETAPVAPAEVSELQPVTGELVPSAIAPVEVSESVVAPAPQEPKTVEAAPVEPPVEPIAQPTVQPPEIAAVPVAEASLPEGEAVAVVVPQSQAIFQAQPVAELAPASDAVEVIAEAESEPVAQTQVPSDGLLVAPVTEELGAVAQLVETVVATAQEPTAVTEVAPVAVLPASEGVAVESSPQVVSAQEVPPAGPVSGISPEPTPVAATEVETVSPALQEIDTVAPSETVVAALSPNEPVSSAVPTVAPLSEPAENVPPVEVATIDPLARVTSYVENYDFGDCAHLSVLDAGADSAKVTAFGAGIGPFAAFDQRFTADQGFEASIELRLVTRQQCSLLNALGVSNGIEAAGLVHLDSTVVRSGTPVAGVIERDLPLARIASAQESGLDLGGKGPPELYIVDDAGRIHDGREYLLPASDPRRAGAWRFKVPVTLMSGQSEETALVLAIWNRPPERQPARFGVLPPGRIAGVLAEPGVFSLSAFKVSR